MNRTKRSKIGFVLCGALLGYATYGQPSVSVGVSVPLPSVAVVLPSVEIHVESDFYEPLTPHGEWVVVGSYGRCWRPGHVARDWRPYSEGYWQRTDDGWYWVSDEPWAWATYHYGRWDFTDRYGWYWVPQTHWAPAWVSWHSGGGYIGWAPLYPAGVVVISPRAYVFVEERHFMEPVRRSTVVVNNTTIINKTLINEAPTTTVIEKASGRKIQAVPVQELRQKQEAAVVAKQRTPTATGGKKIQPPVASEVEPRGKKAVAAPPASPQVPKPVAPTPKKNDQPAANGQPTGPKADKHLEKQEKPAKPSNRKEQRPDTEKPAANENNGANPTDKDHEKKPKE